MEIPSFLQSKQNMLQSGSRLGTLLKNKNQVSIVSLVILLLSIPFTVWLAQKSQIFAPKASAGPIELVSGENSCVVSKDPNKVSCVAFPIRLTSPLGPMLIPSPHIEPGATCTAESQCSKGQKCFNYQKYPGTCKPADTVCAQVITRACFNTPPQESSASANQSAVICDDFPTPCHVPPGWTVQDVIASPSPSASPSPAVSPSAVASPSPSPSPSFLPTPTPTPTPADDNYFNDPNNNNSNTFLILPQNFAKLFNKSLSNFKIPSVSLVDAQTYQAGSITDGLVSYWKLDETSGNTAADFKNTNNGTVTGTTVVDGKFGKARSFSTAGSQVALGNSATLNPTNGITVSAWINETKAAGYPSIIRRVKNWSLFRDSNDPYWEMSPNVGFGFYNTQNQWQFCRGNVVLSSKNWHFVAATYDLHTINLYVNGALDKSCPNTSAIKSTNEIAYIGRSDSNTGNISGFPGIIDEVGIWNRALSAAEIQTLANGWEPGASPVPSSSSASSSSPVASGSGTLYYKVADSEAGLANAQAQIYDNHPTITNFTFSDPRPGSKQIWAEFIGPNNASKKEHISVDLVEPGPIITSLDCSIDLSKQNLKLTLNGSRFGNGSGKVTANGKEAQVLSWSDTQATATIKPEGSLEDGKLFKVILARNDGKALTETSCLVNTSVVSLGARLFCREPGKFDVSNVKVTLVDENGNKVNEAVTIDKDGLIKGLKTKLQTGKVYAISVKATNSLRRNALFTAANGTNVITPDGSNAFILPVGDIAPVISNDGKINTLDRSEIIRQWSVLGTNNKTGDFNRDSKVNSIDWACMRFDFNKEDDPVPERIVLPFTSPGPGSSLVPTSNPSAVPSSSPAVSPSPQASGKSAGYFLLEPVQGGSYPIGDEFIVNINIWSQNEAANLFVAKLSYDPGALEVIRIEKGTVLTSWAEEFFNNSTGQISLTAGLSTPGLKTTEGSEPLMAKVIFRGKKIGITGISITEDSRIYSNSDNSNILTSLLSAQIAITN